MTQWQAGGAGGGRRCHRGVWERFDGVGRARRAFWMAGAYYEAAECERAWQRRRDAQMMERLQQVQEQSLPISGLQRWLQTVINRNARVQPGLRELRGRLANELIRQGARSDGRGRHAVDRVLEWGWGGLTGRRVWQRSAGWASTWKGRARRGSRRGCSGPPSPQIYRRRIHE